MILFITVVAVVVRHVGIAGAFCRRLALLFDERLDRRANANNTAHHRQSGLWRQSHSGRLTQIVRPNDEIIIISKCPPRLAVNGGS